MKRKNMAAMVTSIALVGAVAVGGTLALLSWESNPVTNTFTVGQGYKAKDVILNEAPVRQELAGAKLGSYVEIDGTRVEGNAYNNLIEDATVAKDPQFHIDSNCGVKYSWIVAKVEGFNTTVEGLETDGTTLKFTDVIDTDMENDAVAGGVWYKVTKEGDTYDYDVVVNPTTGEDGVVTPSNMGNGIYIYSKPLQKGQSTADLFQELQVDEFVAGSNPTTITVSGCAVEGVYSTVENVDTPVGFDDMRDAVMTQVNDWAFGSATEPGAGE